MRSLTVGEVLRQLLPDGTRTDTASRSWRRFPIWAPDVFAVAATLAERSGCYAEPGIVLSRNSVERSEKRANAVAAKEVGRRWADPKSPTFPREIQAAWSALVAAWGDDVCVGAGLGTAWKRAAMRLIAFADEACMGVGFLPEPGAKSITSFVFDQLIASSAGKSVLQLPASLAYLISADCACILPKSLTPEVGCTLRSLTHHLALLPGHGAVRPQWYLNTSPPSEEVQADTGHALTLLLVPLPYVVHGTDFEVARPPEEGVDGYFRLRQGWL